MTLATLSASEGLTASLKYQSKHNAILAKIQMLHMHNIKASTELLTSCNVNILKYDLN